MNKPITQRQQAFLDAYRITGLVKPAAAQAGCSRELHYGAMRTSETYRVEFSLVQQRLVDELEEAMWQRAVYGVKIPKFYRGEVIGFEVRYSDVLLMRLLEANDPEKFGGIRRELQQESREDGFCVRWDRDEVGRPKLPRMTGPQPLAPPRPPRPPVPSIAELGVPVTYAEWAAARGITETAACGPVDQEKLQRWGTGEDFGSVEWVPDENATDLVSDDAYADPLEETDSGADAEGSGDSDVGFCVRSKDWDEETRLPPKPAPLRAPMRHPLPTENPVAIGDAVHRPRSDDRGVGICVRRGRPNTTGWTTDCPFRPRKRRRGSAERGQTGLVRSPVIADVRFPFGYVARPIRCGMGAGPFRTPLS